MIGLGQAGLRVLQRLRFDLAERYGPPNCTPLVRTLLIDTDPDTLDDAALSRPQERLAGLLPEEIYAAKLHRAGHYLKPRLNGRSLMEGWFDHQLLYRIPRTPQTMGLRLLGRLAFCDHYRPLMAKIHTELDACLAPDALHLTEQRTGLRRRTNRPRIYVVAGTSGGTGGGMAIDIAYAVRTRLKRMGYETTDVIGVLIVPPADASLTPPQALGNTYATLTELNHFSRPDTTFIAHYDDRNGIVREKESPFNRCYLLPGSAAGLNPTRNTPPGSGVVGTPRSPTPTGIPGPGSRSRGSESIPKPGSRITPTGAGIRPLDQTQAVLKPYSDAADLLRLDLFTPLGRTADEIRAAKLTETPQAGVCFGTFGLATFDWPRAEVVTRTATLITRTLLENWLVPNTKRAREMIPTWAATRWTQFGLDPDAVLGRLQAAAEQVIGARIEDLINANTEPLVPRGWLGRLPEPEKVAVVVDRMVRLFGPPASPGKRSPTPIEEAGGQAAIQAGSEYALELRTLGQGLVEDPQFRLAGAEEVLRQFLATTDRLLDKYTQGAADADNKAVAGYERLMQYTHYQKGMSKPTGAELADALRQFPRTRYQSLTYRLLCQAYQMVRDTLALQLSDVIACRERMQAVAPSPDIAPADVIPGPRRLMPPGCLGVEDAVERFLGVLNETDLAEIDRRVQGTLEPEYGGLFQACFHSGEGAEGVVAALREEARSYLDGRLGEVDLGVMFAERFRSRQLAEAAVGQAFSDAEPDWVGSGPWSREEVVVLGAPGGISGQPVRELAQRALPVAGLATSESRDDVIIFREYPRIPLAAVPHLGPAGSTAYQNLPEANQCSLHARLDVTRWADVDKD